MRGLPYILWCQPVAALVVTFTFTACPAAEVISAAFHDEAGQAEQLHQYGRAKQLYALAMREASDHPSKGSLRDFVENGLGLSAVMAHEADYKDASEILETLATICKDVGDSRVDLSARVDMAKGEVLFRTGKLDEAETHLQAAATALEGGKGMNDLLSQCLNDLAAVKLERKQIESAEALARRAIDLADGAPGAGGMALDTLADILHQQGRNVESLALAKRALRDATSAVGDNHLAVADIHRTLAEILASTGDHASAEQHHSKNVDINRRHRHTKHHLLHESLSDFHEFLKKTEQPERAAQLKSQLDSLRQDGVDLTTSK